MSENKTTYELELVAETESAEEKIEGVMSMLEQRTEGVQSTVSQMGSALVSSSESVASTVSEIGSTATAAGESTVAAMSETSAALDVASTNAQRLGERAAAGAGQAKAEVSRTGQAAKAAGTDFTKLGSEVNAAFIKGGGGAKSFGSTFKTAFTSSYTHTQNLTKSLKSGLVMGFDAVRGKITGAGAAAKTFGAAITNAVTHPVATIKNTLTGAIDKLVAKMMSAKEKTEETGDAMKDMGGAGENAASKVMGALGKLLAIGAVVALVKKVTTAVLDFGEKSVKAFTNFETAAAGIDSVFDNSDAVKQWADDFGSAAGRSKTEIMGFLATSKGMFDNMGVVGEASENMSKSMTGLTYDIAAAKKMSDAEAFSLMKSAMEGDAKAAGQLGLNMSEAALQAEAAAMGFNKQYSELTQAEQAQVRMNAALSQTQDIHGKVIGGQEGLANAQKRVTATLENAKVAVGQKLAPVMEKFLGLFDKFWPKVEPILMQLTDMLANELGDCIPTIATIAEGLLPSLMASFSGLMDAVIPLIPVFLQLAADLLPILADILASVMSALAPLLPVFGELARAVLPPLVSVIGLITQAALPPLIDIFNLFVSSILPPLIDIFMVLIDTVITPIMPLIQELAQTIVPPLANILGMIALSVLPPLVDIFMLLIDQVLMPLMPVIQVLITALLPPLAKGFALIGEVLQFASPIITFVGEALGFVGEVIGRIVEFAANGIGKVLDFFGSIFGGANEARSATDDLGDSVARIGDAANTETNLTINSDVKTPEPPHMPDISPIVISSELNADATNKSLDDMLASAQSTVPATYKKIEGEATKSVTAINAATDDSKIVQLFAMDEIGRDSAATYSRMETEAVRAWDQAAEASEKGTVRVLASINKINAASQNMAKPTGGSVPQYAEGTKNHPGGLALVGEKGAEIVNLPRGSSVLPSNETGKLISQSRTAENVVSIREWQQKKDKAEKNDPEKRPKDSKGNPDININMNFNIHVAGNMDDSAVTTLIEQLKPVVDEAAKKAVDQAFDEQATDMIIQEGA